MAQGDGRRGFSRKCHRSCATDRWWSRVLPVVKFVIVPLAVALVLALPSTGSAAYVLTCPAEPADTGPEITNDAAIEMRQVRQDLNLMCAVLQERLEAPLAERDPDEHDLLELGAWGPLLTFGGVMFLVTAPIWTRAFRMWDDV